VAPAMTATASPGESFEGKQPGQPKGEDDGEPDPDRRVSHGRTRSAGGECVYDYAESGSALCVWRGVRVYGARASTARCARQVVLWASPPARRGCMPGGSGGNLSLTVRRVKEASLERTIRHTFANRAVPRSRRNHSQGCSPAC